MNKVTAALAVLLTGVLALTACSGGSSGGKVLRLWHYETTDSAMGIAWNEAIKEFEAAHPDITVRFEAKSFEQLQKTAPMILNSNDAPDVMEYNKGNATAGLLAKKGLLTDLGPAVRKYGWDKELSASVGATGQYDAKGVMGSGSWYGIPNYGEYVMVFYDKDLFARNNIAVPRTFDDLTKAMDAFTAKGITPLTNAGAEYMAQQYLYQLALTKADRNWVNAYQRYTGKVDFHDAAWTYAMNTFADWVHKGYIAKTSAGLKAEDACTAFEQQKYPMMLSGSWWYGRIEKEVKFDWDTMLFPGTTLYPGSSGNLWVVPKKAKNAALAEEFINITMQKQVQNSLGNNGGIPVAADASAITDPKSLELIKNFDTISGSDGLAYYPDWPSAGFYDTLVSETQKLINGSATTDQVQTALQKTYDSGVPTS